MGGSTKNGVGVLKIHGKTNYYIAVTGRGGWVPLSILEIPVNEHLFQPISAELPPWRLIASTLKILV